MTTVNTPMPKKRGRPPKVLKIVEESIQASSEYANQHALEEAFEPVVKAEPIVVASRPEMRSTMREEDPRTRAARRAAELRDHRGEFDDGLDEFYIDLTDIPSGWTYEWKRKLVLGAEDPAYQVALARSGWEAVPTSRHPSYMPDTGNYPIIERKGMVLMERPTEISDDARASELRKARLQVRQKESQLNSAEGGQFERSNKDQSLVKINRSYESIPIPKD